MRSLGLALLVLVTSVSGAHIPRSGHVIHEKRDIAPTRWSRSRRLSPDSVLPMRFGLKQSNIENLEEMLLDIAHPASPNYGNHWSSAKVAETFAPSKESLDAVKLWLENSGFHSSRLKLSPSKGWFDVNATAEEVEALLDAEYHVYKHEATGKEHVSCDQYSVPHHVQPHIEIITPTLHFDVKIEPIRPPIKRSLGAPIKGVSHKAGRPGKAHAPTKAGNVSSFATDLSSCDAITTPDCLRALYEVNYTPVSTKNNSFAIVEYTPDAYLQSDLDMFFRNFSPSLVGTSPKLVSIDGGVLETQYKSFDYNGESDLDLQYAMALAAPQPVTLYQVGDTILGASFDNLLDALDASYCTYEGGDNPIEDGVYPDPYKGGYKGATCGVVTPANVISTSYAGDEADLTPFYATRQCNEYGKLGLMGVTILYSSGDQGVAGNGGVCLNADGTQTSDGIGFNPLFPASCPFVTAVGATQVNPNSTVTEAEAACEQYIYSGGGFSNFFKRPSYQDNAVNNFMKNYTPPFTSAQFNTTGSRGFPDLSANGANFVVASDGAFSLVFGTSASTPVVGAILTLINDARLAAGKKPIGFINPTIYSDSFKSAFNDITSGSNQGCGTTGFTSAPGWDPVTGLGTPNFPKMLDLWLSLP